MSREAGRIGCDGFSFRLIERSTPAVVPVSILTSGEVACGNLRGDGRCGKSDFRSQVPLLPEFGSQAPLPPTCFVQVFARNSMKP